LFFPALLKQSFPSQVFLFPTFTAQGLVRRYEEHTKMGSRKRTQEEKAQAARENGFDSDMSDVDDSIVLRKIEEYTQELYNEQMDTWHA
jgi:hypothetical protein